LRRTTQQVEDLVFLNLPARLAKLLLRLVDEAEGTLPREISITQREISQMIGVSRESINKQLRSWAQVNFVALKRGGIVVLQPDALIDVARQALESEFT
jgi:CRP-like cAMP-binding protein